MKMDQLISGFINQLHEALNIGRKVDITAIHQPVQNVVVSGLGGSGIGGNLTGELTADELKIPFAVNKDYFLPHYVDKHSLVIISSYSGNTEETVEALQQAIGRKAQTVCITSNGMVAEIAEQHQLPLIRIPGGMPPRACLGYSFVQQLFILSKLGLISNRFENDIENAIALLKTDSENIKEQARGMAEKIYGKLPVLYISAHMESVAVRFRQQLNENSKLLCWHHVIPEMNHNELVGWRDKNDQLMVIFLRNEDDYGRIQRRIEINKKIIAQYTPHIEEIWSKGNSRIEKALYLIHLCDWISFYLAEKRGMDAVEVRVIDYLKSELAKP